MAKKPAAQMIEEHANIARCAAEEGMVLLRNNGSALPLPRGGKLALYGGGAVRTVRGGTGSGDPFNGGLSGGGDSAIDQSPRFHIHVLDAFLAAGYEVVTRTRLLAYAQRYDAAKSQAAPSPMSTFLFPEDELEGDRVDADAKECGSAVYVLSRNSGEGTDRSLLRDIVIDGKTVTVGDYDLSETEAENLKLLRRAFSKLIVVLNVGGIVNITQILDAEPDAVLLMGQPGQEGGAALVNILSGTAVPSGKLTDTWAARYADYPASATFALNDGDALTERYSEGIYVGYRSFDKKGITPVYAFGFGLSYTRFQLRSLALRKKGRDLVIETMVTNTGELCGKEVVQCYVSKPETRLLDMPVKELAGFAKTRLLSPGESELVRIKIPRERLRSFETESSSFVIAQGLYRFYVGSSSDQLIFAGDLETEKEVLGGEGQILRITDPRRGKVPSQSSDIDGTSSDDPGENKADSGCAAYEGVREGRYSLRELTDAMPDRVLAALCCGSGWGVADENNPVVGENSQSVPGAAGETTWEAAAFGVPRLIMADGPAGLRIRQEFEAEDERTGQKVLCRHYTTAFPTGTVLAQSFSAEVLEQVGAAMAEEMEAYGVDILLGPGMNIHRDPLCGRNFEYFSEDPLLSGLTAAALVRGIQKSGHTGACIKHFAANNQETLRSFSNSAVDERTLREIYLTGFEIAVKESDPAAIMTAYNLVNGVPAADSVLLCTRIAREEWGFGGLIMTDWNGGSSTPWKAVLAGNDLMMPGGESRIENILSAMSRFAPEFEDSGRVRTRPIIPGAPMLEALWRSFIPESGGKDTITTRLSSGYRAIAADDGKILILDEETGTTEPLYLKATDKQIWFSRRGEAVNPFSDPADTDTVEIDGDGKVLTYRGRWQDITLDRAALRQCAERILEVMIRLGKKGTK